MGIDSKNYGHLLIPILLKQLPHDLVIEYHRKRDSGKTGDVHELIKFIKFEIESRESANIVTGHTHKVSESRQFSRNSSYHGQPKIKPNAPSSAALNTVVKNVCIFCNCDTHPTLKCNFLTNEQKHYKLKKEGLCYRCMMHKHLMSKCQVKISPCETCQSSQHNFLFCPKNKAKSSPLNKPKSETDQKVMLASVMNSQDKPGNFVTLLQTAKVEIQGNGSQTVMARLLFDPGSQKSFVRSDLKQALKLKTIRKEKLLIYTFSKRQPEERIYEVVALKINSQFPPYKSINIEALASDEITGADIYANINPRLIESILPASCLISDSYEKTNLQIQILLGADYLYNAMSGEARKIQKNLYLQPTSFGDTLIGQIFNPEDMKQMCALHVSSNAIQNDLKSLWEIDSLLMPNESPEMKPSDTLCNFGKELTITNNRYECPLQWKSPKMRYNAVMKEQIQAGIIEMCSDECFIGYVMPHREVLRDSSSSTKIRIVYDASSKSAATIKTHIKKYKEKHPLAYEMLNELLYVDDLFYGSSTTQDAFTLSSDAVSILKDANMNMRKFDTNSKELKDVWLNSNSDIETNEHSDNHLKVLGFVWNNLDDTLDIDLHSLLSNLNENECTKRNVLHTAAKLFDPSGFISPFLIRIKFLLQELWQLGIGWDEVFTGQIKENFQNWCKEIKDLQNLKIPRYYFPDQIVIDNQDIQLHVFSDASLKSFGAVAYLRYKTSKGKFQTSFVISKSRVAPIKKLTLPRLELMGAIIASRIVKHLKGIFKDIKKVFCWSDSTIVLHWIKGSASKYKQFVANRVIEIQETTDPISWRHCSGKHNPADLLTRGLASRDLITFIKWWHSPEWLRDAENLWPKVKEFENELVNSEVTSEYKSCVIVSSAIVQEKILDPGKFSCLRNLLRVTAWVVRFVNALKRKNAEKGPLTSDELTNAEMFWVRITQNYSYSNEITCLKNNKSLHRDSKVLCLNPFLDSNGILRFTGRLGKSTHLSTFEKHPIILPSKTKLTELLIWDSHKKSFHSGVSHKLVQVREKYWILKCRQTIKSVLSKCTICKRFNSSPGTQVIAPLPDIRVEQSAPFTIIGVDFAGPLFVKDTNAKQYILLITCAVTRSVHLELVGDMTTDTFLLAFRRFISRRGLCSVVISDNARTFKRAELEIKRIWNILNHPDVKNFYSFNGIKWQYIVERAAWWGGFYERMVRTVKTALRKTLGKSCLTVEQLLTVLIEIEGMINSRPITYVGSDTEEPTALTPAHFFREKNSIVALCL
ncbi:hypothetical protein AVEN_130645-1 [Araneus ventricosus]|uniref:Integrase catalytic domain-containing protein n=1 Tax=Araneus ventricosus TaxID=182803 RepID=A0A4Y2V1V8_ARAVE|nr:hypothetical protein AVEN_130645-1 [Araneus ventricosus]